MLLRRFGLAMSVLGLATVSGTMPAGAGQPTFLVLAPASGPVGTTVTVSNDPADANGKCGGGLLVSGDIDMDILDPAGDEIASTDPQFATREVFPLVVDETGDWTVTFTVPAGLAPGDEIRVRAGCLETPPDGLVISYELAIFTVTAAPTNGGGTTTTLRPGTTATTIPPGGGGTTPVPTPLARQPRFTG